MITVKGSVKSRAQQTGTRIKFQDVAEIKRPTSIVVYGPSGSGKTTFASSAPKPMLYIDVKDDGTDSISDVKGIKVARVESIQDLEEVFWYLKSNPGEFKSVVIDTCTQVQSLAVNEVVVSGKKKGKPGDWGTMTRRDWGDVAAILKSLFLDFRDLTNDGLAVIFIAQDRVFNLSEEEESNDELLAPEVGPALSPSIAKSLNASVNVIVNTYIREREVTKEVKGKKIKSSKIEYCLGVGPSALYRRKIRKPKVQSVPDVVVNPEFADVVDIIKGRYE
jgi:hypothetical protein